MDSEALLAGLNEKQTQAVVATGGPLVVHAGAGSGKTRVLTRRIAWRIAQGETDPNRVLALTFTRKAAGELRQRLRASGLRDDVVAGTFHGVALTQLRQRWSERGIAPPAMLDRKYSFVRRLVGQRKGVEVLDVINEIEWARARLVAPADYGNAAQLAGRTPPMPPDDMAELMERFQQEKRQRRVVDFDDLLALAIRDLQQDGDYAAAVRWRHRHLYVDEFQDVNPLQFELLRAWRGTSDDLFVVGDPNQAIYGWNGADPNLLNSFGRREPDATVLRLDDNYRSTPQVLDMATAALGDGSGRLIPHQPDGPVPTLNAYPTDLAEAAGIARAVKAAHFAGDRWSHQAVLVRTNAQLVPIEQALAEEGIPVRLKAGAGPLGTPEVKQELQSLTRSGVELRLSLERLDSELESTPDDITNAEIDRRANLQALSRLVHEYMAIDWNHSGPGLRAWLDTLRGGEVGTDSDAVELSTFHGAKGLEWPVVHVAGLEQGYVPISYAETGAQLAEERRLLYVAITRAEKELHLSWAAERTFGTKPVRRQPSPHLAHLQASINRLQHGHRPVDWKTNIVDSRQQLSTGRRPRPKGINPNPVNDPVFEDLKAWRRTQARAADVPPYVVFNDQTLRAIAKRLPTTRTHLAGMPGMTPGKLDRYGQAILDILAKADAAT